MTPRREKLTLPPGSGQRAFAARVLELYDARPRQPGQKRISRDGIERAPRRFHQLSSASSSEGITNLWKLALSPADIEEIARQVARSRRPFRVLRDRRAVGF